MTQLNSQQLGVLFRALADLEEVKYWKGEITGEQMEDAVAALTEWYQDALIDAYEYETRPEES